MLQSDSRYRVRQIEDRPLREIQKDRLYWRYLFYRSAESFANLEPSQDYLTYQYNDDSFVFAVCDGVGQSFFGDLASRLLGEVLSGWLCSPDFEASVSEADVRTRLGELLRQVTQQATAEVAAVQVPVGTPQMVEEVLNDKRKSGSESTFVCARVDLPTPNLPEGRLIAAWMGDTRLRAWGPSGELRALLPTETFQTDERWSSKNGPVMGDPHLLITPLGGADGSPAVIGLMAYTDGLAGLDRLVDPPTNDDLKSMATGTRHGGQSDDIAFIEVRFQTPVPTQTPEPAQTPVVESRPAEHAASKSSSPALTEVGAQASAPVGEADEEPPNLPPPLRERRRRQRTPLHRDPVVLASLVGIVVVLGYLLRSLVFPEVSLPGDQPAGSARAVPAGTPVLLLSSLDWQPQFKGIPPTIQAAYDHYWAVTQQAFLSQDPAQLADVMVGSELTLTRGLVVAQTHSVKLGVQHSMRGAAMRGDEIVLTDVNKIDVIDQRTNVVAPDQPVPYGVSTRPTYVLVKVDNTWKVSYAE